MPGKKGRPIREDWQHYDMDEIALTLKLVFATNRTALICATIENKNAAAKTDSPLLGRNDLSKIWYKW